MALPNNAQVDVATKEMSARTMGRSVREIMVWGMDVRNPVNSVKA
jgi:hypothetical protein